MCKTGTKATTAKAVIAAVSGVAVATVDRPVPAVGEVVIQVAALGLCRTDLRVISGEIDTARPRIPGHEFSGIIDSVASDVSPLQPGDRVAVNPVFPCGQCRYCDDQRSDICQQTRFLGVDLNGALAEFVAVPAHSVHAIPDSLSYAEAAFSEPMCASLAVLKSGIQPHQRGLILGHNRIAELTRRVLVANQFHDITVLPADFQDLPQDAFDFAIETVATTETIHALCHSVVPGGRVILKSRQPDPVQITVSKLLPREVTLCAVNYGCFQHAVNLLADRVVKVDDLIGPRFSLNDFASAVDLAERDELRKIFIEPNAELSSDPGA
ncbi:MAG: alcohol dehydrogenase catalytic domain-containing protein [Fuerstiella sp.]|nr:L-threonine 3-dehydrogenase [Fuerstiella sp.]